MLVEYLLEFLHGFAWAAAWAPCLHSRETQRSLTKRNLWAFESAYLNPVHFQWICVKYHLGEDNFKAMFRASALENIKTMQTLQSNAIYFSCYCDLEMLPWLFKKWGFFTQWSKLISVWIFLSSPLGICYRTETHPLGVLRKTHGTYTSLSPRFE